MMRKFRWLERRAQIDKANTLSSLQVHSAGAFGNSELTGYSFQNDRGHTLGRMLLRRPVASAAPVIQVESLEVKHVLNPRAYNLAALLWTVELAELESAVLGTNPAGVLEDEAYGWQTLAEQGVAHEWKPFQQIGRTAAGGAIFGGNYQVLPGLSASV
jgi:hypothetical protein